jgi:hypothetical protein
MVGRPYPGRQASASFRDPTLHRSSRLDRLRSCDCLRNSASGTMARAWLLRLADKSACPSWARDCFRKSELSPVCAGLCRPERMYRDRRLRRSNSLGGQGCGRRCCSRRGGGFPVVCGFATWRRRGPGLRFRVRAGRAGCSFLLGFVIVDGDLWWLSGGGGGY